MTNRFFSQRKQTLSGLALLVTVVLLFFGSAYLVRQQGQQYKIPTPIGVTNKQAVLDSIDALLNENNRIAARLKLAIINARQALRKQLKDPASYQEVSSQATFINTEETYIQCLFRYRLGSHQSGGELEEILVNVNASLQPVELLPLG